jgi:hypothetical protein
MTLLEFLIAETLYAQDCTTNRKCELCENADQQNTSLADK